MRPDVLLPALWVHWSWLSPPRPPRHERALREASVQLIYAYPALVAGRVPSLPIPKGRPAFARFCRLVAATAAGHQVRLLVRSQDRRQLTAYIGADRLDQLQRRLSVPLDAGEAINLSDRFSLTAQGLALVRRAQRHRGLDAWWSMRLPRALSESPHAFLALDAAGARACMAGALRLWRSRC